MIRTYLLNYDDGCGEEDEVLAFLDKRPEILNWSSFMPSSVLIVSESSLSDLTRIFTRRFRAGMFLLVDLKNTPTDGMLPNDTWDFINKPKVA